MASRWNGCVFRFPRSVVYTGINGSTSDITIVRLYQTGHQRFLAKADDETDIGDVVEYVEDLPDEW